MREHRREKLYLIPDYRDTLSPYGWNDHTMARFEACAGPGDVPGRVVRVERARLNVVGPSGAEEAVPAGFGATVGDWVSLRDGGLSAVVERWSELVRKDPMEASIQVLAANFDLVIVTAPADRLSMARVERELAVAWESGAQPLVVITKSDLADSDVLADLEERLSGVDVVLTSASEGSGIDDLRDRLRPRLTAVLLGPSGAGKSSLANSLLGHEQLATGAVRSDDRRGRHTTSWRQLVTVPGGGILIDSPGIRSLGLASGAGIGRAFPDVEDLAAGCRFRDCRHDAEPGCAVRAAVDSGDLSPARFDSWRKLVDEATVDDHRHQPLPRPSPPRRRRR